MCGNRRLCQNRVRMSSHDRVSEVIYITSPSSHRCPEPLHNVGDDPGAPTSNGSSVPLAGAVRDPSWKPLFALSDAPAVRNPYNPDEALDDLPGVQYALEAFLSSHMLESEEYCHTSDETK